MENDEIEKRIYGPVLPSNIKLKNPESSDYFGPQLPPHLLQKQKQQQEDDDEANRDHSTSNDESSNDDDQDDKDNPNMVVGPIPSTTQKKELEERALEIKIKGIDGTASTSKDDKSREEWMTELPDLSKSGLGIFARQFRKRDGPDMSDRSIWTDTPNSEKSKKSKKPSETEKSIIEKTKFDYEKDKEQDDLIKKHKKKHKRNKTLMEIHDKKLKKEKKKKDKEKDKTKAERRPFNREEDLQVNRFDLARKQAVIKKAQLLDTRFSTGKSKYL